MTVRFLYVVPLKPKCKHPNPDKYDLETVIYCDVCRRHLMLVEHGEWGHIWKEMGRRLKRKARKRGVSLDSKGLTEEELSKLCPCGYLTECHIHCGSGHNAGKCPKKYGVRSD